MTNNFIDIAQIGFASFHAYFFFFFGLEDSKNAEQVQKEIDSKMKNFENCRNPSVVKNTLRWIIDDQFSEHFVAELSNRNYFNKLKKLKDDYLNFYEMMVAEIPKLLPSLKLTADLVTRNEEYILQITRLRMIVDPEIQLTTNIHKQTKIAYIRVKGFWINDEGVKERKFVKSLGRLDEYENGINGEKAFSDGRAKIREAIYEEYLKYYKE
jgi:hypothetical protein